MWGLSAVAARRTVRLALAVPPQRDALVLAGAAHCVDNPLLALEHLVALLSRVCFFFRGARCAPSPALEHTYPTAFGEASRPQLAPLPLLLLPPSLSSSCPPPASLGESRRSPPPGRGRRPPLRCRARRAPRAASPPCASPADGSASEVPRYRVVSHMHWARDPLPPGRGNPQGTRVH